jgi:hypothetical protein
MYYEFSSKHVASISCNAHRFYHGNKTEQQAVHGGRAAAPIRNGKWPSRFRNDRGFSLGRASAFFGVKPPSPSTWSHMLARAKRADRMPILQESGSLAVKLLRTYTAQVEALARLRRGGEQRVRSIPTAWRHRSCAG